MNKYLILTIATLCISFNLFSQEEKEDENLPVIVKNASKGYIIDTANQKINSYIILMGTDKTPWINQRIVKAIPEAKLDASNEKQKFEKYNKSDILGYGTETRNFRLIDFMNLRASIVSNKDGKEASMFDQMQSMKNFSKQKHFAEILVDGKYKIYKLYAYPKDVNVTSGTEAEIKAQEEEELRSILENYSILIQKDTEKVEYLNVEDLEKIASDCDAVKKKLENGDYNSLGYEKPKKKGLMGKMAALANKQHVGNAKFEKLFIAFFTELNTQCK